MYAIGTDHLLIVTTDRLSAFDVVMPDPVPGNGCGADPRYRISGFTSPATIVANHLAGLTLEQVLPDPAERAQVEGARHYCEKIACAAGRGHRARLPDRFRLEGLSKDRHGMRHCTAARPATGRSSARAHLHAPRPRPMPVPTTSISISHAPWSCWARGWPRQVRDVSLRIYSSCAALRAGTRHHHCRHQVRVRRG